DKMQAQIAAYGLQVGLGITDEEELFRFLLCISRFLPDDAMPSAIQAAMNFKDPAARSTLLGLWGAHLRDKAEAEALTRHAFQAALAVENGFMRQQLLSELAPLLNPQEAEIALKIILEKEDISAEAWVL